MLISSPGDVPVADLAVVQKSLNRWNVLYGPRFGGVVLPVSWSQHAAAEFGAPPQEILNEQIVDGSDICLAIFANRLGTPTAEAESGTAEEIERLAAAGSYVGVLRCKRQVDASSIDPAQLTRLNDYLAGLRDRALILDYSSDAELERHVDSILVAATSRDQGRGEIQRANSSEAPSPARFAEVWPRVDVREEPRTDARGRPTSPRRHWTLVVSNTGNAPARNVRFRTELPEGAAGENWMVHRDESDDGMPDVELLSPHGGEVGFQVFAVLGSARQVRCTVGWEDDLGQHENSATLSLS